MWFMHTLRIAALVVAVAALGAACGDGGSGNPAAPTPTATPTPPTVIAQAAGVWTGVDQRTSVAGGECVGVALASMVGGDTVFTLEVAQSGSALTAVSTAPVSGLPTNYSGTAGLSTISLGATSPDTWVYGFSCSAGQQRDVEFVTDTINMTVSDNTGTGTTARTFNVFVAGTRSGVGTMTIASSFSVAR
jgi:hypothetical protein